MTSIIAVVVLLGALIFVHELGHFLMAKFTGVGVLKFSLGFGPRLVGMKIGETEYMISLFPLGGYVKLLGEAEDDVISPEEQKRSFLKQRVANKMLIVAAGPVFNLLLAIVIFSFVYSWGLPVLIPKIGEVQEGSAARHAGLQKSDTIQAIDGKQINTWADMAKLISESDGKVLRLVILRTNKNYTIDIRPELLKAKSIFGEEANSYKIGVSPSMETRIERLKPWNAVTEATKQTYALSKLTVLSVFKIFQGVVSPKTLGGPIMIAQLAGAQAREGMVPFLLFMALLSINLAVLNLLPIPILDGGHLFFYIIEAVTGKEIHVRWRERAQQIGFVLLIMLMMFVLFMDIERLNIKFIQDIINYFSR